MSVSKVVIVGSGVAAATVATGLLEHDDKRHITILDAGAPMLMADRRVWLDYLTTGKTPHDSAVDNDADITGDTPAFIVRGGRLFARGGSTIHWGGWAFRFKPEDFRLHSGTGRALDWPLSYADLEPYYLKGENFLRVAGDSTDEDPPRHGKPYPVSAVPFTILDGPIAKAITELGHRYSHIPIARNENCVTTGTCNYCPVGGRYAATMTLDLLEKTHPAQVEVMSGRPVRKILMRDKSTAAGVQYVDLASGEEGSVEGDVIVLCAGALESPKLLLASATKDWPNGLGNASGHVGRHLVGHALLGAHGILASNPKRMAQEIDFPTLGCRAFDTEQHQAEGKFFFLRDDRYTALKIEDLMRKPMSASAIDAAYEGPVTLTLTGFVEEFESPENAVSLGSGYGSFGLPRTHITYKTPAVTEAAKVRHAATLGSILQRAGCNAIDLGKPEKVRPRSDHASGTCRMSATAADGVVDKNLQLHDVGNVYVCSNGTFPNVAAVNPTLTLTALAFRLADHLAQL